MSASDAPAILLVDHGSRRTEANEQLEEIARLIRARAPGRIVKTAHLELAEPSIAAGVDACVAAGATAIIVHPYMLTPGRHSQEDIPNQAKQAARKHPNLELEVSSPLGIDDRLIDLVLFRVASTATKLR